MAFYCATMLSIALELAPHESAYDDLASKFFEHFVAIVDAMNSFGGNGLWDEEDGFYYDSNWRGPIWIPLNYLFIEALERYHHFYGESLRVECPTDSGRWLTLREVAAELGVRLARIFMPHQQRTSPECEDPEPLLLRHRGLVSESEVGPILEGDLVS